jgi:transcriptional regulator with XRE-family HTH domain
MSTVVRSTADWEVDLGQRVRNARKQSGLSQAALADRANVSMSAVRGLEAGNGSTLRTFVSVVRALGLDAGLDRLFNAPATVSPVAMFQARNHVKIGR